MLRLSTRTCYALRAMLELSLHHEGRVLLRGIADSRDLPLKYLEQLAMPLRRAGLVEAQRGSAGGYVLARPPEEISLLEIVEAVEGALDLSKCVAHATACPRAGSCPARCVWVGLCRRIRSSLGGISLAQMRDGQTDLNAGRLSVEPCAITEPAYAAPVLARGARLQ